MPYTFEFEDETVRSWSLTPEGAEYGECDAYTPSLFVDGPEAILEELRGRLEGDPKVSEMAFESWHRSLHEHHDGDRSRLLRADLERVDEVGTLAREIRGVFERDGHAPGTLRLFDVDLSPGFRYCLDEELDPTPSVSRELRTLRIEVDDRRLASRDVSTLRIDGEPVRGEPADVLWSLGRRLERRDPDVLVLSHADLVPTLEAAAETAGLEGFHLGRLPGSTRLAGENTYASYGQVGHSPARYRVPGRAIVDTSNSFLWHQSGLAGLLYMVRRTGRPLQEAAWGSIGTLLTSRQIRLAREKGVLAPQNKWEPERFKDVSTLHAADRGGFTFAPEVGLHEEVHEIDFASLYPRIICEHNVSPETIGCGCPDEEATRVPELEYPVCDRDGFLPEVLTPLLDDRRNRKRRLASDDDRGGDSEEDERARLRAEAGAIKWVLVSCFGYQGYRNAKFGRIECHEAINAYARDILLESKARLEDAGWRVVHGIVDSLWVTTAADEPEPLGDVTAAISREVGIDLERDGSYEWVCFVPRRESIGRSSAPAGALTKYFGKRETGAYKFRGLECRQRHTPAFVADCQREFVETLDETRAPEAVCDRLERRLGELRRGAVDPSGLVITTRVSKSLEAYAQESRTVGALRRYESHDVPRRPGQPIRYVVTNDDARRARERVRLAFELDALEEIRPEDGSVESGSLEPTPGGGCYDADFYADQLKRAAESVVSPLGWDRARLERYLADGRPVRLSTFRE